jgi:hypothetical protein
MNIIGRINSYFHKSKPDDVVIDDATGCKNCGSISFYEGPSGGMSVNIMCAKCGIKYNDTPFGMDFIGSDKPIKFWHCRKCGTEESYFYEYGKYPTCRVCGSNLHPCWTDVDNAKCNECLDRYKCYTNREVN